MSREKKLIQGKGILDVPSGDISVIKIDKKGFVRLNKNVYNFTSNSKKSSLNK